MRKKHYTIGEKAVYPAQGMGEIVAIENREIHGKPQTFLVFQIAASGVRILVPRDKADAVGLRPVAGASEVDEVLAIIREESRPIDKGTWNRRYRGFIEKVKSGSLFEIAEVFRDLHHRRRDRILSFGERRIFDVSKQLIVSELAAACATDADAIAMQLEQALGPPPAARRSAGLP